MSKDQISEGSGSPRTYPDCVCVWLTVGCPYHDEEQVSPKQERLDQQKLELTRDPLSSAYAEQGRGTERENGALLMALARAGRMSTSVAPGVQQLTDI